MVAVPAGVEVVTEAASRIAPLARVIVVTGALVFVIVGRTDDAGGKMSLAANVTVVTGELSVVCAATRARQAEKKTVTNILKERMSGDLV